MTMIRSVCVFCGSRDGENPAYREAARELGAGIASRGLRLVFGGGRVGLMGVVADAALAAGGEVIGIIPDSLYQREVAHVALTELLIVGSMHERKAAMADRSDAFIALPGGFGTFEEFFEVLTWAQLGFHRKPCLLLDVEGYWSPLAAMVDRAVEDGFIPREQRSLMLEAAGPAAALDALADWRPEGVWPLPLEPAQR
jgi:uncharacterized protein (TIGR00730 family)